MRTIRFSVAAAALLIVVAVGWTLWHGNGLGTAERRELQSRLHDQATTACREEAVPGGRRFEDCIEFKVRWAMERQES